MRTADVIYRDPSPHTRFIALAATLIQSTNAIRIVNAVLYDVVNEADSSFTAMELLRATSSVRDPVSLLRGVLH